MIEVLVGEWQAVESARAWQDGPVEADPVSAVDEAIQARADALVARAMGG